MMPRMISRMMRGPAPQTSWLSLPGFLFVSLVALAGNLHAQSAPVDSVSAVFRDDSTKVDAIRSLEAGTARLPQDSTNFERNDSLVVKQRRRGPFVGLSAGVSFANNSAKKLFSDYMTSTVSTADSSRIVQPQDPVQIIFPVGLVVGFPVFPYLDVWLRTEHFWSRVNGLTQRKNEAPKEFWYVSQGHLAGIGARYLVPVSLLSVNGEPGLFAAYTHFWNFGPTGMYAPTGAVRAKTDPSGAGYEIQLGYQQDYDKRFTFTGGLSFSRLAFVSNSSWKAIVPTATDERAEWTLQALRLSIQGIYQIGK
jgi:hypothetical protein